MSLTVRPLAPPDIDTFVVHLGEHLAENGAAGSPLFSPSSPNEPFDAEAKRVSVLAGLARHVGKDEWLRVWGAFADGALVGHLDLCARHEPSTAHRALLGLGVLAPHRGRGVGRALLDAALAWARTTELAWIDLFVFASNARARALYDSHGFVEVGRVVDLFRVNGRSIDDVAMTLRL